MPIYPNPSPADATLSSGPSLSDILSPDNYRNFVLPLLGVAEAIGTHGRSPGTSSLNEAQAFDVAQNAQEQKARQLNIDQQNAAKEALQNKLGTMQLGQMQDQQMRTQQHNAILDAISQRAGVALNNIDDNPAAPNVAPNAPKGGYQMMGEFQGETPQQVQAMQLDPEKGIFALLDNSEKAPLVQSEIDKNAAQAYAAQHGADVKQDKSDWGPPPDKNAPVAGTSLTQKQIDARNKIQEDLNKQYTQIVTPTRGMGGLQSAANAYTTIKNTLNDPNISPIGLLGIKDQLVKLLNGGGQLTNTQFNHADAGGTIDALQAKWQKLFDSGANSVSSTQRSQYMDEVNKLGKELAQAHADIKSNYLDKAHTFSQQNNLGADSVALSLRNLSFDPLANGATGNTSDDDIINQVLNKK